MLAYLVSRVETILFLKNKHCWSFEEKGNFAHNYIHIPYRNANWWEEKTHNSTFNGVCTFWILFLCFLPIFLRYIFILCLFCQFWVKRSGRRTKKLLAILWHWIGWCSIGIETYQGKVAVILSLKPYFEVVTFLRAHF